MKKTLLLTLSFAIFCIVTFGQENNESRVPRSQADMYNDFFVGYGGLSIYYFINGISHNFNYPSGYDYDGHSTSNENDPMSAGTFYVGFHRTLNRVVSTGFTFAYQKLETQSSTHNYNYNNGNSNDFNSTTYDNLLTCIAQLRFCYLDEPFIRMYSGIGVGITLDFSKVDVNGVTGTDRKIIGAGQLTIVGLRVGRALGGFAEFGIGSIGIVNAGISYKFGD